MTKKIYHIYILYNGLANFPTLKLFILFAFILHHTWIKGCNVTDIGIYLASQMNWDSLVRRGVYFASCIYFVLFFKEQSQ